MKTCMILAAAVLGMAATAHGAAIIQPVAVSTSLVGWGWDLNWTINQAGLYQSYVSGVTDFDSFVPATGHFDGWNFGWTAAGAENSTGVVDFDLGAEYAIESFASWECQGPAGANGEMASFNIYVSNDPTFTTSTLVGGFAGDYNPFGTTPEVHGFSATNGRYVRIDVLSFYAGDIAFGEFAFEGTAVPTPAATALLGLGGVVSLRRRRR